MFLQCECFASFFFRVTYFEAFLTEKQTNKTTVVYKYYIIFFTSNVDAA